MVLLVKLQFTSYEQVEIPVVVFLHFDKDTFVLLLAGTALCICVWWWQVKGLGGTLSSIYLPKPQYFCGDILRSAKSLCKSDK